jgi:curved DNA-binding protein CbpA
MPSYTSSLWAFFGFEVEQRPPPGADDLQKAYRAEALKSHPDKHPEDPIAATSRPQFVKKAYDELMELIATGAIKNAPVEEPTAREPEHEHGSDGSGLGCNGCCRGEVPLKGREAKEAEKKKRQAENLKAQVEARRKKCAIVKEENREMGALQALRDEFDSVTKKPFGKKRGGQSAGQGIDSQAIGINIVEVTSKALALTLKQHNRNQNLRPRLNCAYSDGNVDGETVKPDVQASLAAEKKISGALPRCMSSRIPTFFSRVQTFLLGKSKISKPIRRRRQEMLKRWRIS